jgi:hypothetical protein
VGMSPARPGFGGFRRRFRANLSLGRTEERFDRIACEQLVDGKVNRAKPGAEAVGRG